MVLNDKGQAISFYFLYFDTLRCSPDNLGQVHFQHRRAILPLATTGQLGSLIKCIQANQH